MSDDEQDCSLDSTETLGPCPICGSEETELVGHWKIKCQECGLEKRRPAWWVMQKESSEEA